MGLSWVPSLLMGACAGLAIAAAATRVDPAVRARLAGLAPPARGIGLGARLAHIGSGSRLRWLVASDRLQGELSQSRLSWTIDQIAGLKLVLLGALAVGAAAAVVVWPPLIVACLLSI